MLASKNKDEIDIKQYQNVRRNGHHREWRKVVVTKPKEIGTFSLDSERKFHCDDSQLKQLIEDKSEMDLNDGYKDRFVKRDENIREGLDFILMWIKDQNKKENLKIQLPNFVLWRGHMTKIMCTPYETRDGWKMAAQKREGTIYISEIETEEAIKNRESRNDRDKLMMYWGVRFEGYMTKSSKSLNDDVPEPKKMKVETITNTNEAFCTVLQTSVNQHSVLYSGEVDCWESSNKQPPDNYVELKTSRILTSKKQSDNFHRYKTLKWWAQSYLAGVPVIVSGFRDDDGIVKNIKRFDTLKLPNLARQIHSSWNPNICLDFLDYFFARVKSICLEDDVTYILEWRPGDTQISCVKDTLPKGVYVLPEWYLNE